MTIRKEKGVFSLSLCVKSLGILSGCKEGVASMTSPKHHLEEWVTLIHTHTHTEGNTDSFSDEAFLSATAHVALFFSYLFQNKGTYTNGGEGGTQREEKEEEVRSRIPETRWWCAHSSPPHMPFTTPSVAIIQHTSLHLREREKERCEGAALSHFSLLSPFCCDTNHHLFSFPFFSLHV